MVLVLEERIWEAKKEEFLRTHPEEWVLIYRTDVIAFFQSYEAAYAEGVKRFGNVPMLIKWITDAADDRVSVPALQVWSGGARF